MKEQYYCLQLEDYSAPSICSWSKGYYGTLDDIRSLVHALAADKKRKESFTALMDAFQAYENGDHSITHLVGYQEVPLLEPVKLLDAERLQLDNYTWEHTNTWGCPYRMRCDRVETTHLWLSAKDGLYRAIKARFQNLCYEGFAGSWRPLNEGFWGFPQMLVSKDGFVYNRLAMTEKQFENRTALEDDIAGFLSVRDVDFKGFCEDVFGDG